MKASQLRDLTRKYAAGGMPYDAYVAERTRLINGMVSGEIEIIYRDLEPANRASGSSPAMKRGWYMGGSLMLTGLLLVALLAYFMDDGDSTASGNAANQPPSLPVATDPGVERLQEFVVSEQWSEDSLLALEADWNTLTPFEKESARRSIWFRRLKHETARRIGEQEALLEAGQMEALLQAGRLREFATRLGFEP